MSAQAATGDRLKLLPVSEVHAETGIPESTIRRLCALGEIPALKVGRKWRIKRAYVDAVTAWSQEAAS